MIFELMTLGCMGYCTMGARAIIEIKISVIWYVKGREPPGDSPGPVAVECQVPSDAT